MKISLRGAHIGRRIRLGRIDGSFERLQTRGQFPLQIDLIG